MAALVSGGIKAWFSGAGSLLQAWATRAQLARKEPSYRSGWGAGAERGGGAVTTHGGPEIQPRSLWERGERPSQGACLELQGRRSGAAAAPTRKLVCRLLVAPLPRSWAFSL